MPRRDLAAIPYSFPITVVMGDLNHDARADIVAGHSSSDSVSVWLGNGDGTFLPRVDIDSGRPQARVVAIPDLDLDQHQDLLVAHGTSGFSVFLGNGDGTFGPPIYTGGTAEALDVAIALLDADTYPDVALAHSIPHGFSIFLGNGDGTFASPTFYPSPSGFSTPSPAITLADLNQDGEEDLLIGYLGALVYYFGNGDGTFSVPPSILLDGSPQQIAVGDLNEDSVPDIVAAQAVNQKVSFWLGSGGGTFGPRTDYDIFFPYSVALGDLDGDGNVDLAATNIGTTSISVMCGNGNGTFLPPIDFSTARHPASVALGNLNGDRLPDLVAACNISDSLSVSVFRTFPPGFLRSFPPGVPLA